MKVFCFIIFTSFLHATIAWRKPLIEYHDPDTSIHNVNQEWFPNYIDHLDHFNQVTFQQRYWYSLDHWDRKGPIILYICAEGVGGFPGDSSFITTLAKENKAVLVSLEHRYYGSSVPFAELTVENLKYLSHDQALADVAYFIRFFKRKIELLAERNLKLFTIGGSYAGALSAWMRYKYPYLVDGALSSSGVVDAVLDFHKFDEHVRDTVRKSGESCENRIHELLNEVQEMWKENKWEVKKLYKAPFVEWDDFMFFYADIFVEAVQYGKRTHLCSFLESISNDPDKHSKLATFAEEHGVPANMYSFDYIRNTKSDPMNNYRQWTYQYCSSLAYFNTIGKIYKPLRFIEMTLDYWRRYCEKAFGVPLFPDTFHTNSLYGDLRIAKYATNIVFTNGGEDAWQWASIREYSIFLTSIE